MFFFLPSKIESSRLKIFLEEVILTHVVHLHKFLPVKRFLLYKLFTGMEYWARLAQRKRSEHFPGGCTRFLKYLAVLSTISQQKRVCSESLSNFKVSITYYAWFCSVLQSREDILAENSKIQSYYVRIVPLVMPQIPKFLHPLAMRRGSTRETKRLRRSKQQSFRLSFTLLIF